MLRSCGPGALQFALTQNWGGSRPERREKVKRKSILVAFGLAVGALCFASAASAADIAGTWLGEEGARLSLRAQGSSLRLELDIDASRIKVEGIEQKDDGTWNLRLAAGPDAAEWSGALKLILPKDSMLPGPMNLGISAQLKDNSILELSLPDAPFSTRRLHLRRNSSGNGLSGLWVMDEAPLSLRVFDDGRTMLFNFSGGNPVSLLMEGAGIATELRPSGEGTWQGSFTRPGGRTFTFVLTVKTEKLILSVSAFPFTRKTSFSRASSPGQ